MNEANNPREAFENMKKVCPELDVEECMKQMDFVQSQLELAAKGEKTEIPIELTEYELDMVNGGSWLPDNWRKVVEVTCISAMAGVAGLVIGAGLGGIVAGPVGVPVGAIVGGAGAAGFTAYRLWNKK